MAKRSTSSPRPRDPFDSLDGELADQLDIHGWTGAQAREQVPAYLQRARRRFPGGLVLIVTGRGRHSPGEPVLKPTVERLLRAAPRSQVAHWGVDFAEGGFLVRLSGGRF